MNYKQVVFLGITGALMLALSFSAQASKIILFAGTNAEIVVDGNLAPDHIDMIERTQGIVAAHPGYFPRYFGDDKQYELVPVADLASDLAPSSVEVTEPDCRNGFPSNPSQLLDGACVYVTHDVNCIRFTYWFRWRRAQQEFVLTTHLMRFLPKCQPN